MFGGKRRSFLILLAVLVVVGAVWGVYRALQSRWQVWASQTVEALIVETDALVAKANPLGASRRAQEVTRELDKWGSFKSAQFRLMDQRRILAKAYLEQQKRLTLNLIRASDFKALSEHTATVKEEMQAEAKACGVASDFDKFCDSCLFLADLSQLEEREKPAKSETSAGP